MTSPISAYPINTPTRVIAYCSILLLYIFPISSLANNHIGPQKVLLLHTYGSDYAPFSIFTDALLKEMEKRSPKPIDLYEASIYSARFDRQSEDAALKKYLKDLFTTDNPDLIITIGAPAMVFAQRHRRDLFSDTPVLYTGVADRRVQNELLTQFDAVVASSLDLHGFLQNIFNTLPDTKQIAVVLGNSNLEKFWADAMRHQFETLEVDAEITFLNEMTLPEMLTYIGQLPSNSAVFYFMLAIDAAGVSYPRDRALGAIHGAAKVPLFGYGDNHLGQGIIGGPLIPNLALGKEAAIAATRLLEGESPANIRLVPIPILPPIYDWRELQRWDIPESRLPQNAEIRHREISLWNQYRLHVIIAVSLITIQALLIGGLVLQHSRRKQAETALRKSEQIHRATLSHISDIVFITRADGDFTFISPNVHGIFGYSVAEAKQLGNIRHLLGENIFDPDELYTRGELTNIEIKVSDKAHNDHDLLVNVKLVDINQGTFLYTCRNISDRRQAEETRRSLIHAQRLAHMGELTAMIAHEVNQPLGAILGNAEAAEIMLSGDSPPLTEIEEILADIRGNVLRADESIRNIRGLLRKRELRLEPLDINQTITEVFKLATGDALQRQILLQKNFVENPPPVLGDRIYLQQVLLNLIVNAMDAMKDAPESLRIISVSTAVNGDFVDVAVSDHGHGIDNSKLSKIFDSFFTTKQEGMGLGLSIVGSIIKMHGGRIRADNNAEHGATFQFSIPTARNPSIIRLDANKKSADNGLGMASDEQPQARKH